MKNFWNPKSLVPHGLRDLGINSKWHLTKGQIPSRDKKLLIHANFNVICSAQQRTGFHRRLLLDSVPICKSEYFMLLLGTVEMANNVKCC